MSTEISVALRRRTGKWLSAGAILLVCVIAAESALARSEGDLAPGMVNPGYEAPPAWFKNSFLDIREDIAEATAEGRRLMLYFYQDGCPYCKKLLQDNFGQQQIARRTRELFDVVAINMWGDRDVTDLGGHDTTEKAFARQLKVNFTPTLLLLDETGQVVVRINGYYAPHLFAGVLEYVGGRHEKEISARDYLARIAPVPATGRLHTGPGYLGEPYRLAEVLKESGKPLLVMFEQKECAACDELHLDILRRDTSRELLKEFNVVLLDMWSETPVQEPGGRDTRARDWARNLEIRYAPSLVFFDASGREVFRSEAYLKAFHIQSILDYVASGAYRTQPEFQRYIDARADSLRAQGIEVDLMK